MGILVGFVLVLFVPVCVLLTLTILLQDSKGGGLSSSAFGASEMQSMLGGQGAATFLTKLTTWLAIGFMVMSLFLMRFYGDTGTGELKPLQPESAQGTVTGDASEPADDGAATDANTGEAVSDSEDTTDTQVEATDSDSEDTPE